MKRKYSIVFHLILLLFIRSLYAYPDCDDALTIDDFNALSNEEKLEVVHPLLLKAFCDESVRERNIKLYLKTFKNQESIQQRLEELWWMTSEADTGSNGTAFYDFLFTILERIEKEKPKISEEIQFINMKYLYVGYAKQYSEACTYLNQYSFLAAEPNLPKTIQAYFFLVNLSKCAENANNYNQNIFYLMKALALSKELPGHQKITKSANTFKLLAKTYFTLSDYKKAEQYADSCINVSEPYFKNTVIIGVCYELKALINHLEDKNTNKAIQLLERAQEIQYKLGNISRYHYVESLKAEIYLKENPELATAHLFKFIDYFYENKRKIHHTRAWLLAHDIMAVNHLVALRPKNRSIVTHQSVIDSLTRFLGKEDLKNSLKISQALMNFYGTRQQNDSLLKYSILRNKLEEQDNALSLNQTVSNISLYLENHKKEEEINQLFLLTQKQKNRNKLLYVLLASLTIIAFILIKLKQKQKQIIQNKLALEQAMAEQLKAESQLQEQLIYKKEQDEKILKFTIEDELKQKKILELELKQKQQEIENVLIENEANTNLIEEVIETLRKEDLHDLSNLARKLSFAQFNNKQVNSLKELFLSVSPDFMQDLEQINANLTELDYLYCILIKQNYTTKQISIYLNVSPKSVNQHKYRLKKKLFMSDNETLSEFIQNLNTQMN